MHSFLWEFLLGFKYNAAHVNSHLTRLTNYPQDANAGGISVHHNLLPPHRFNGKLLWNKSKSALMEQPAALRLASN
jgi:hypothetical protein